MKNGKFYSCSFVDKKMENGKYSKARLDSQRSVS